ncbi:hypothetical protein CSA_004757, partial [Cucumis sativus]
SGAANHITNDYGNLQFKTKYYGSPSSPCPTFNGPSIPRCSTNVATPSNFSCSDQVAISNEVNGTSPVTIRTPSSDTCRFLSGSGKSRTSYSSM